MDVKQWKSVKSCTLYKKNCIFRCLECGNVDYFYIYMPKCRSLNGAMPQKMPFYFILLANKKTQK